MKKLLRYFLVFTLAGCSAHKPNGRYASSQLALEEARLALIDVQKALSKQKMDLQLLEEKINLIESPISSTKTPEVAHLENKQKQILFDLKQLTHHSNETSRSLEQFRATILAIERQLRLQSERIDEMVKLKSTLNLISKAIGMGGRIHKVESGDSLEKIARKYNSSVEAIKQANDLRGTTIFVGQKLNIP